MIALFAAAVIAPPAVLPARDGWHVGTARVSAAGCLRCVQTESFAATIRYRDPPNQLPPHETMARLGPHGLIVHVTRAWEPSPPKWVYRVRPVTIVRGDINTNFEGNTTRGRVSLWQTSTWRAGSFVTIWVLFGSPVPSRADVARAQRELGGTRFPLWRIRR